MFQLSYDVTFARVVRTTKKPFPVTDIKFHKNAFYGISF